MPLGIWNIEWLDANSQRAYPITAESSRRDTTNSFKIPDSFLVGLDLPIHAGLDVDPGRFFLKHIGAYATGYSIIVGYQPVSGAAINVATALIARGNIKNTTLALGGISPYDDTVGKVTIGELDDIDNEPPGFWTFTLDTARLEPDAIRPIIRGISSLVIVNGAQRSAPLYGDIELVAGVNCQLGVATGIGTSPTVTINFLKGEGSLEPCVCAGDEAPPSPIFRINGIAPTANGDFTIVGSDCLSIDPITNGLRLSDTCATPCCGCAELERITRDLERLADQAATITDLANRLGPVVDAMNTTVLGGILGDQGCSPCNTG